jgi:hypothetical protein
MFSYLGIDVGDRGHCASSQPRNQCAKDRCQVVALLPEVYRFSSSRNRSIGLIGRRAYVRLVQRRVDVIEQHLCIERLL